METREIRLKNLLALSDKHRKIIDFCRKVEMNPSYFSQIKSGKKAIGDEIARKLERKLGLDRGYLDTIHDGAQAHGSPVAGEVMAAAYSMQMLPAPLRDQLSRLIHQIAAYCQQTPPTGGFDVGPFDIAFEESNGSNRVQKTRRRG